MKDYPCGNCNEYYQTCVLYMNHPGVCDFTGVVTICKLLDIPINSVNNEKSAMSFTVWISFDTVLTGLHYPPKGKKREKDDIQLGNLEGIYYTVGKLGSRPLPFATKSAAKQVAQHIPNSVIEKEENF